jgi:hypothetical protein
LTKARREQIIESFKLGREDPEYSVAQTANGGYQVRKRKIIHIPTTSVDNSKNTSDVQFTWMNLQTQMNESLTKDIHKLRKKYEKLADKYEDRHAPPHSAPPPAPQSALPRPPKPIPQSSPFALSPSESASPSASPSAMPPPPPRPLNPKKPRIVYKKPVPFNVRDF